MKTAIKMMLTAALLFSVNSIFAQQNATPATRGQGQATPEQRAKMMTKRFETNLGLTSEQSAKIQKIFEANIAKMAADAKAQKELMSKTQADTKAQITKILTPEQAVKFQQFEKNRKDQAARSANNRRPNGHGYHANSSRKGHTAQGHKMIVVNGQRYVAVGGNIHMSKSGNKGQYYRGNRNNKPCNCGNCKQQIPQKNQKAS